MDAGAKPRTLLKSTTGCRSEVNLRPRNFLIIPLLLVVAAPVATQLREAPKPILVDVIGPGPGSRTVTDRRSPAVNEVDSGRKRGVTRVLASVERSTFQLMNTEREAKGLGPLKWNATLADVARLHSQNMADNNFFSHRGLDGFMVDDRAAIFGVTNWQAIGENIAFIKGYTRPEVTAVEKWMNSASHRRNMLSEQWTDSAIGVAVQPDGTYYFTQVFMVRR